VRRVEQIEGKSTLSESRAVPLYGMRQRDGDLVLPSRKSFFIGPAFFKDDNVGKKKSEERAKDLCAEMVVQVDDNVVGRFPDQGPEELAHPEYSIIGMIDIRGENLHAVNVVEKRGIARSRDYRNFNVVMRCDQRPDDRDSQGHIAQGGKPENQDLYKRHV
jgi:hypothetical protein